MQTLTELYDEARTTPSDIWEHVETFVDLVVTMDAQVVIELGVRSGVSTIAWLYALDATGGKLWSVDINSPSRWFGVMPGWTFVLGDDMDHEVQERVPDRNVDILFIDTSHAYQHTFNELLRYGPRVRSGGVIVLHDTEVEYPDGIFDGVAYPVRTAVTKFCGCLDYQWENRPNNNGLAIIRIP